MSSKRIFLLLLIPAFQLCALEESIENQQNWKLTEGLHPVLSASRINQLRRKLVDIGFWLRNHKYYEIDQRYAFKHNKDQAPYFYQSFPVPVLRQLVPHVANNCQLGIEYCINEIHSKFEKTTIYQLQKHNPTYISSLRQRWSAASHKTTREVEYEPFKNKLEKFQYRSTASYFMCYYTLRRSTILQKLNSGSCQYNRGSFDLEAGKFTYDIPSLDHRAVNDMNFSCALLSFCPDACCGKISGPVESEKDCQQFEGNPCYDVSDGTCRIDPNNNENFNDMMRNRINVTCDCEKEKRGYRWSNVFSQCVDDDECEDETSHAYKCTGEGQTCQNTIGRFMCTCRWGFRKSDINDSSCIVDETLGYRAVLAEETNRIVALPEGNLFDFKLEPPRKNVPWTTRAVYNLNYYSAVILNHTLHFYNLAGFESWVQSWSSACSNTLEPDYLLLFCLVCIDFHL